MVLVKVVAAVGVWASIEIARRAGSEEFALGWPRTDVPNWVVRLAALALLMFTGSLAFWLYVIAWVALAPKASRWSELPEEEVDIEMEYDEHRHTYRRKTVFRYTDAPAERVRKATERVAKAASRIEAMERYVTSRQYDLNREFSKL